MKIKYILVFVVSFFSLFLPVYAKENIKVLGIGDSITTGYGVEESYSFLVFEYLEESYPSYSFSYQNLAINGQTSSELLDSLSTNSTLINSIYESSFIMMSIGSNDVLALLNKIYQKCLTSNCLLEQNLLKDELDSTITVLENNLKYIIEYFIYKVPEAKLIIIPFYNPYQTFSSIEVLSPYIFLVDEKKDAMNSFLESYDNQYENIYVLSDLVSILEENNNVTLSSLDPHPTSLGHKLIYESIVQSSALNLEEENENTDIYLKISIVILIIFVILIGYYSKKVK